MKSHLTKQVPISLVDSTLVVSEAMVATATPIFKPT